MCLLDRIWNPIPRGVTWSSNLDHEYLQALSPTLLSGCETKGLKKLEIRTDERSNFLHSHSLSYSAVFYPHTHTVKCAASLGQEHLSSQLLSFGLWFPLFNFSCLPWYFKDNIYWEKCIANTLTFQCIEVLHFHGLNFSENQNMRLLALFLVLKYCDALCVAACKYSV